MTLLVTDCAHACVAALPGLAPGLTPRKGLLHAKPVLGPASIGMFWPELLGATCLPRRHCLAGGGSAQPLFCAHLIRLFHIRSFVTVTRQSARRRFNLGFVLSQPFFCARLILKRGPSSGPAFISGGGVGIFLCMHVPLCVYVPHTRVYTHRHTGLCVSLPRVGFGMRQVDRGPGLPPLSPSSASCPP